MNKLQDLKDECISIYNSMDKPTLRGAEKLIFKKFHPLDCTLGKIRQQLSKWVKESGVEILPGNKPTKDYSHLLSHEALEEECEKVGLPAGAVSNYWYKGEHFSVHVKGQGVDLEQVRNEMINDMKEYSPLYPKIVYNKHTDGHLLVIDPADIHVGKLASSFETGETYNKQIAVQRVREGVQGILDKVQGYQIDQILFIGGNDVLHVDTPGNTTTSGTGQDADGMWYDSFTMARRLMVEILEKLIAVAPVHYSFCPSNHDFMSGFMLSDAINCWFRNCPDITFDVDMKHRKYFEYGKNCIGTTHGDGAKLIDLPLLMAQEAGTMWQHKHRYIYTHHLHHKVAKDFGSVCVETLRSPSGTDSWHHRKGYQHAPKAVEGFLHSKDHGQVARLTHIF